MSVLSLVGTALGGLLNVVGVRLEEQPHYDVLVHPAGATWEMALIMPSTYTLETVPLPNDPRVQLSEMPAEELAVIRFSGAPGDSALLEQEFKLRRWLQGREDYEASGSYRYAAYDPPFTIPFLRRNEIMIPVARVKRPHAEPMTIEHPGYRG